MDPVTQAALGAAVAEAGFRRRLGGRATVFGALVGLAPDADVVFRLIGDEWSMMRYHRGATHSLLVAPLLAAGLGWLGWRWSLRDRRAPERPGVPGDAEPPANGTPLAWAHLALWVVVTHVLLDWCTSYGTVLLWPVSSRRFALDAVAIVDPLYTVPLVAGLVASLVANRRGRPSRLWAAGALVLTTAYLALGWGVTLRAAAMAREKLAREGFEAAEVRVTPHVAAGLVRRVAARDARGNLAVAAAGPFSSAMSGGARFDLPGDGAVRKAMESEHGRLFSWFAMGMVAARVERREGGGSTVRLDDQRYGFITDPAATPFSARFELDEEGGVVRAELFREIDVDVGAEAAAAWGLMLGGGR